MCASENNTDQHLQRFELSTSENSIRFIGGGKLSGFEDRVIRHVSQVATDLCMLSWNRMGRSFGEPMDTNLHLTLVSCTCGSANSDLKLYSKDFPDGYWDLAVPRPSMLDPFSGRLLMTFGGGFAQGDSPTEVVDLINWPVF